MKSSRLIRFVIGLIMLAAGILKLFGELTVTSGIFSRIRIGGMSFGNGIFLLPFIIGIILLFTGGKRIRSVGIGLMALGIILLVLNLVVSASIHFWTMNLSEWILLLVLIFGGPALMASALLGKDPEEDGSGYDTISADPPAGRIERKNNASEKSIEEELKDLKHRM